MANRFGKFHTLFIALMFALPASPSAARAEETLWQTAYRDFASPITTRAKWALLSGALATGTVVLLRDHLDTPFQRHMATTRPLGKWHRLGDWGGRSYLNAAYVLGMFAASELSADGDVYRDRSLLMLKSTAYTAAWTLALKASVRAPRPGNKNERTSWPSGHTSAAFSFASVVGAEHEWYWGLGAYSLATFTALSRLNDNRHFVRDVLAGATIGISYGLGLYYRNRGSSSETAQLNRPGTWNSFATVIPSDDLSGATFSYSASF